MRRELVISLLVILGVSKGFQQETKDIGKKSQDQECPTWFIPQGNHKSECECGVQKILSRVVVKCDEHSNQSMLLLGFCMTYNESTDVTVVGSCPYNSHKADYEEQYVKLPQNVSHLKDFMCGGLDRTGLLCSHCKMGLGIPVFSYMLSHCLPCLESLSGWILYIVLAVFPTTVFFLIVIIFQVRITSAPMNAFIFFCQFFSLCTNAHPYVYLNASSFLHFATIVLSTFYGFWNLDFFRYVIPPFCISDQLTPIQVVALEYVVAFYPLFLIITTYICVELYVRECRLIVWLWRPFSRCLTFVLRGRELKFSLVHAFSSFLLLSYSKISTISIQLLAASNLHNSPTGQTVATVVYYDASIRYFSASHLPYAFLAIIVSFTFVILPAIVLLLYPTRTFQRCLGCCRVRWLALHAFADTFNGYYKNGFDGTRDYRYFAGLYLIFRVLPLSVCFQVGIILQYIWGLATVSCVVVSLLFALLRPYKNNWINIWDSVVFALIAFISFWVMYSEYIIVSLPYEVVGVIATVPLIYIIVYVVYRYSYVFKNCRVFLNKHRANSQLEPDRLLNPQEYRQLLPTADCPENKHSNSGTPGSRDETYPACGNSLRGYGSVQ